MAIHDAGMANKKLRKELNAGTVALVLLGIMSRTTEPMYGYQIAKQLHTGKDEGPGMKQGALYPVLRSLENSGLLESRVEPSVSGPPRRYYQITEAGRETLKQWKEIWHQTRTSVENALKGTRDV